MNNSSPTIALTDAERFPALKDLSFLRSLQQDEYAPAFNFKSGDRLTAVHLQKLEQYAAIFNSDNSLREKDKLPAWLPGYVETCIRRVPAYRSRNPLFSEQPTISRADVKASPWQFVSDDCSLDELLVYQTSGTTGPPMDVLFDPVTQASWLIQLQSVLRHYNMQLAASPHQVAVALICFQQSTLTYASLSTYLGGAGILKINLWPTEWKEVSYSKAYLEKYNPQILTGDPFAFMQLLELSPRIQPKAIISSAMKLSAGLQKRLEERFNCPVLDIYSLTECRMVAFAEEGRHRAIRPDLYPEVFDRNSDRLLPYGERGELVISGGNNPFLPLIRYRTGDTCSIKIEDGVTYLIDLEARDTVALYDTKHQLVNNIEISRALLHLPLAGFSLHQQKDKTLLFTGWSNETDLEKVIQATFRKIFGNAISIHIIIHTNLSGMSKPVTYSSEFEL